jgi:hypothetical protein
MFSVRYLPRCYKYGKSRVQLVVRQSQANEDINTEVEGSMTLEAITRQRLVKRQPNEKI